MMALSYPVSLPSFNNYGTKITCLVDGGGVGLAFILGVRFRDSCDRFG
jgi:hypothetical protein